MGKLLKGPWPEEKKTHLDEHRDMLDNLIKLIADMKDSLPEEHNLPLLDSGDLALDNITIGFLLQFAFMNAQKLTHEHKEKSYVADNKGNTEEVPI